MGQPDVEGQAAALGSMNLQDAERFFLEQAKKAKSEPGKVQTWGPGGVGGIGEGGGVGLWGEN